jgi:hypothetical protein
LPKFEDSPLQPWAARVVADDNRGKLALFFGDWEPAHTSPPGSSPWEDGNVTVIYRRLEFFVLDEE